MRTLKIDYQIIYETSSNGWAAYVPDLPGLGVAAGTRKEVKKLIREGIKFHLEGCKRNEAKRLKAKS